MNTQRKLFCLFQPQNLFSYIGDPALKGWIIIHRHSFPNDEPPYIQVTFWGDGVLNSFQPITSASFTELEDGEDVTHYLIRAKDAQAFINWKNENQVDYCDYYLEGIYTRQAGEHNLSPREYASEAGIRQPNYKIFHEWPNDLVASIRDQQVLA